MTRVAQKLPWPAIAPPVSLVALALTWGRSLPVVVVLLVAVLLAAAVLSAVHHAEVVAHKVGEPFGSLVLAVAVTVIEVALVLTLMMSGKPGSETLARDTVFAAVMITCNGIVGLSIIVSAPKDGLSHFNAEGAGSAFATVLVLVGTCLVLPAFTTSVPGPAFSGSQLAFAAIASLTLYVLFVITQTVRHRDFFLPKAANGDTLDDGDHAEPPTSREALISLGLMVVSLVAVVGLAKVLSPSLESAVAALGFPAGFVGVIIALLVLAPETLAATKNARRGRTQTSLNLAYGSAMARVGLTVPTLAAATIFLDLPLHLGLGPTHLVLLVMTGVVGVLTIVPGRATRLHGALHVALLAAYVFLAINP